MSDKCTIFVGGEPVSQRTLDKEFIDDSTVYGADKGYYLARDLGIECDIVIGDFDSSPKPQRDDVLIFPVKKDDTDLCLAIKHAFSKGLKSFMIYGALGGSVDHLIGNIQSLAYIVNNGGSGVISGDNDIITLLPQGRYIIKNIEGFSLSLFAYSEKVEHLSISGTKYEADDITLDNGFPLGVSNSIISESACVSFSSGKLLVIQSRR